MAIKQSIGRFNQSILVGTGRLEYAVLAIVGFLPFGVALIIGVWSDRVIPVGAAIYEVCPAGQPLLTTAGFGGRWNWLVYPLVLPIALLMLRYVFRIGLGYADASPLVTEPRYKPIREKLRDTAQDWRVLTFVVVVALLITGLDQYDVVQRLAGAPLSCPTHPQDWGYYSRLFSDVSLSGVVTLTALTTLEQMIVTVFALFAAVYVYRFNAAYMESIYLRDDPDRTDAYTLDFDDPDRRFGLRKLSSVFDLQLWVCVVGGLMFLVTRYMNSDLQASDEIVMVAACLYLDFEPLCGGADQIEMSSSQIRALFPDVIQIAVVVSWVGFLFSILWIANVKLLPLTRVKETVGRIAYLEQLIRPGTKYDEMLKSGDDDQVEIVAARFRQHNFWPTGDRRASDTLALCMVVFFLMLLPIVPDSVLQILALIVMVGLSMIVSRIYVQIQRHRLTRVDESLVRNPHTA